MGKIGVKHVEGDCRVAPRFLCGKLECCLGVDELPYEPGRGATVDFRIGPSDPNSFEIVLRLQERSSVFLRNASQFFFELAQNIIEIATLGSAEIVNFTNLLSEVL